MSNYSHEAVQRATVIYTTLTTLFYCWIDSILFVRKFSGKESHCRLTYKIIWGNSVESYILYHPKNRSLYFYKWPFLTSNVKQYQFSRVLKRTGKELTFFTLFQRFGIILHLKLLWLYFPQKCKVNFKVINLLTFELCLR